MSDSTSKPSAPPAKLSAPPAKPTALPCGHVCVVCSAVPKGGLPPGMARMGTPGSDNNDRGLTRGLLWLIGGLDRKKPLEEHIDAIGTYARDHNIL